MEKCPDDIRQELEDRPQRIKKRDTFLLKRPNVSSLCSHNYSSSSQILDKSILHEERKDLCLEML